MGLVRVLARERFGSWRQLVGASGPAFRVAAAGFEGLKNWTRASLARSGLATGSKCPACGDQVADLELREESTCPLQRLGSAVEDLVAGNEQQGRARDPTQVIVTAPARQHGWTDGEVLETETRLWYGQRDAPALALHPVLR